MTCRTRLADPASPQARMLEHCRQVMACREAQPALRLESDQAVSPGPPGVFLLRRFCPSQPC